MSAAPSLRRRVATSFVAVGLLIVIFQGLAVGIINHYQETELIDQIVSDELEDFIESHQRLTSVAPRGEVLRRYSLGNSSAPEGLRKWFRASWLTQSYIARNGEERAELPAELSPLEQGFHDVVVDTTHFRVGVRDIGEVRFYLAYTVTFHQERLNAFRWALGGSALATLIVTILAGYWLSRQITGPVTDLAQRVNRLQTGSPAERLDTHYRDRELEALARAFDDFQTRTTRLLERERMFTADVSHELRTPLTSIQTSCELLLDDENLPPKGKERVEKIARAVTRLTELIGAFLMLAREQNEGTRDRIDLAGCIEDALEPLRDRAENKGLTLVTHIAPGAAIEAPSKALQIVVGNLLANAVSYTDEGEIHVAADATGMDIIDTGSGIAAEQFPELFRRFRRGDTARAEGFGLGLSIVKRICDQAGWKISIECGDQGGTKVRLAFSPRI